METTKEVEEVAPTNGQAHGTPSAIPSAPVVDGDIKIEPVDCISLLLLAERFRNLELQKQQVELQRTILTRENDDLFKMLSTKYGVTMSDYTVHTDIGVAKKRS